METMKRRTKAEKRKKMAGMQKARDMMTVVVGSGVEEGEGGRPRGKVEHAELLFIRLEMERSKRSVEPNPEMPSRTQPTSDMWPTFNSLSHPVNGLVA